ncbi:hypothetical protein [Shinella sp.]|uniref:hypothetical protein n=1 Tax=Shinella sp. TaxID=1870904 RepID=UPI002899A7B2|nr:hypothetical protein [Shinella sp.]
MEGVTPGKWYPGHLGTDSTCQCRSIVDDGSYMGAIAAVHVSNGLPVGEGGNDSPPAEEAAANMRFIAACNPVAMREVLALARQAEALQRENAELREALRPFAVIAGRFSDETSRRLKPDDHNVWGYGDERTLTYGDFRRARALLGGENAE